MEWFIVAIVYIWGEKEPKWTHMNMPFQTRELCQKFYQTDMAVRDDITIMYPNARSHTLVCLDKKSLDELKGTQI